MSVRMDPDLLAWVKSRGGSTWVRYVAGELRQLSEELFLRKEPHLIGFLLSSSLVQISLELYISKP